MERTHPVSPADGDPDAQITGAITIRARGRIEVRELWHPFDRRPHLPSMLIQVEDRHGVHLTLALTSDQLSTVVTQGARVLREHRQRTRPPKDGEWYPVAFG